MSCQCYFLKLWSNIQNIKLAILATFKWVVRWHAVCSHCRATTTTDHLQNVSPLPKPTLRIPLNVLNITCDLATGDVRASITSQRTHSALTNTGHLGHVQVIAIEAVTGVTFLHPHTAAILAPVEDATLFSLQLLKAI